MSSRRRKPHGGRHNVARKVISQPSKYDARKTKPAGTTGVGRYQHADSRQIPPENMLAFLPQITVYSLSEIPFLCKCTWVPHTHDFTWELKFSYALCPIGNADKHADLLAAKLPA